MPPRKRPVKSAEAQPPPPLPELPQPTARQPGELAMENWDLSKASEAERARAQDLVDTFNAIKGDMRSVWREELAAFVHDCTWQRLASNPSSLESYKKLKGNAGRQKHLYFPYWFEVATYFPPSHPTLQPIREELSQLWGVNLPADRIYYPQVDAKKESACFQGTIPTPKPTLPTGNYPAPERHFTPINPATTSNLQQQPSVTQSPFATSKLFATDSEPKSTHAALPGPPSTFNSILKQRPTGSPTLSTAALAEHDWEMDMETFLGRIDRFPSPGNTLRKRRVTFASTGNDQQSPSSLDRSDGGPTSRPSPTAQPTEQKPLLTSPAPTDSEQMSARKRPRRMGPDFVEKRTRTLRMEEAHRRLDVLEGQRMTDIEGFQTQFAETETKTTLIGERVDEIGSIVDETAKRLGNLELDIGDDDNRLDRIEERLTLLETKTQSAEDKASVAMEEERLTLLEARTRLADDKATAAMRLSQRLVDFLDQ